MKKLGVAAAVTLVLLTACNTSTGTVDATTTTTAAAPTTATSEPLSPKAADQAWRRDGGQQLIDDITAALADLRDTKPDGIAAACVNLRDAAQAAIDGPQNPVPVINAYWQSAIDSSLKGANKCVESVATGDPETVDDLVWYLDMATRSFQSAAIATDNLD